MEITGQRRRRHRRCQRRRPGALPRAGAARRGRRRRLRHRRRGRRRRSRPRSKRPATARSRCSADMTNGSRRPGAGPRAEAAFGPIGLFFSNAGIIVAGGAEASDEAWSRIWAINVHSHVYVARAVLPGMLARGGATW